MALPTLRLCIADQVRNDVVVVAGGCSARRLPRAVDSRLRGNDGADLSLWIGCEVRSVGGCLIIAICFASAMLLGF